jgi:hypothetical protein
VIDVQETPFADIAIAAAVIGTIRMILDERLCSYNDQKSLPNAPLKEIILKTIKDGEDAVIDDDAYLKSIGLDHACSGADVWRHLIKELQIFDDQWISPFIPALDLISNHGTLSTRILRALGESPDKLQIIKIYRELGKSLSSGLLFQDRLMDIEKNF